ncbi:Flagellar basal-body rod protein FlgC [Rhodovastum atsumiense]|uniref:Flagellar biosynthesis protein FlgC n=1 Tax=Rhodovastum atsumiense TaxID=504468 RepID=A0A5M6IS70_9PROT|nr:flagellar basal body protein [Rhodovastum atsumiense]KAA5611150.1 flagellar biosynthesis protein FlgC [Rhodovastum atsumiense]CAH2599203.1 Flagellar basal-body rod protein FlgC [Rhodovastum atsumiense]
MDAMMTAVSGLTAAARSLDVIASNVANARTTGRVPTAGAPQTTAYQPIDIVQIGNATGGVEVTYRPTVPATTVEYDPTSPHANASGLVAAPNVDPAAEVVNQYAVLAAYEANSAVMRAANRIQGLLDRLV